MRDWGAAGFGLRKAGDGDGEGEGEASEGVELDRDEEGAEGASWSEAASELVVDLRMVAGGWGRWTREERKRKKQASCKL